MDKNYKGIKYVLVIIGLVLIIFISRSIIHKKEIASLLKKQDLTTTYVENVNLAYSKIDRSELNKIKNYSEKVNKKEKKGKDFISESEAIKNSSSEKETNTNNNIRVTKSSLGSYSNEDVELLARLINSEAGNEPYMGKIAVGNVVLYRAEQNKQSIESVIYSKNQFDGINTDGFHRKPSQESINAAIEVLSGTKVVDEGYFFANLKLCDPSWAREKTFIGRIGDHWFFKKE